MRVQNTVSSWGWPARFLHWVMAVLVFTMLGIGFHIAHIEEDLLARFEMTQSHKSVGFMVFMLAVLRIIWRTANSVSPANPDSMRIWQKRAAGFSHLALYVLMIALPLTGWLMVSASPLNDVGAFPFQVRNMVFGLFAMPDPFPIGNAGLERLFNLLHQTMAVLLVLVLLAHVTAALKHHFIDRDTVLTRILFGK